MKEGGLCLLPHLHMQVAKTVSFSALCTGRLPARVTVESFHIIHIPFLSVSCCQGRFQMKNHIFMYVRCHWLASAGFLWGQSQSWWYAGLFSHNVTHFLFLSSLKVDRLDHSLAFLLFLRFLVFTNTENHQSTEESIIFVSKWQFYALRQQWREISTFFSFSTDSWMYF